MERISQLLYKHVQGQLTDSEQAELHKWAATHPANGELLKRINDENILKANLTSWYAISKRSVADDARLDAVIAQHEAVKRPSHIRQLIRRVLPYAAAVFILASIGTWYLLEQRQKQPAPQEIATSDVLPGGNRATLTLVNGKKIDLSSEQSEIIIEDEHITYSDGSSLANMANENVATVSQLALSTPKGGTYRIILPDGSKVWLNAASTIQYPSSFTGKERVVEVSGEAYFQIQEDSQRPFKVRSREQEVQVLGTEFNIMAYPDENETKTTLVAGKVRLSPIQTSGKAAIVSDEPVVLAPGEQATLSNGHMTKSKVEVSQYTAWKDGFFYFNRLPTSAAIAQLARWYDLDVIYQGKLPDDNVFANIDRNKPLSAILTAFEKSGLEFKVAQSGAQKQLIVLGEQE